MTKRFDITKTLATKAADGDSEAAILGSLIWYGLRDLRITRKHLEAAFNEAGLDKKHLPRDIRAVDAFRRATKVIEGTTTHENGEKKIISFLVRDVGEKDDEVIRKVVKETRNLAGRRLAYDEVAELSFNKVTQTLTTVPSEARFNGLCKQVEHAFDDFLGHYTASHLRAIVHSIVESCDPVRVRPTGAVYFIPRQYHGIVEALTTLLPAVERWAEKVGEFHAPSACESVLLIDSAKHRELILSKFDQQTNEELESGVKELAAILKGEQEITVGAAQRWVERLSKLREVAGRYEGLLEAQLDATKTKIGVLGTQVSRLVDKLQDEEAASKKK